MSISKKIIENTLWGERTKISAEIVAHYKQNPKDLDLILDQEYFYGRFIRLFFVLGFVLTMVSRLAKVFLEGTSMAFLNDVLLDLISELGIAIFGGAITAYFLERIKQRQYQENIRLRNEILDKINPDNA